MMDVNITISAGKKHLIDWHRTNKNNDFTIKHVANYSDLLLIERKGNSQFILRSIK